MESNTLTSCGPQLRRSGCTLLYLFFTILRWFSLLFCQICFAWSRYLYYRFSMFQCFILFIPFHSARIMQPAPCITLIGSYGFSGWVFCRNFRCSRSKKGGTTIQLKLRQRSDLPIRMRYINQNKDPEQCIALVWCSEFWIGDPLLRRCGSVCRKTSVMLFVAASCAPTLAADWFAGGSHAKVKLNLIISPAGWGTQRTTIRGMKRTNWN